MIRKLKMLALCSVCKKEFIPTAAHIRTCPECIKQGYFEEHTEQYQEEQKKLLKIFEESLKEQEES